VWLTVGTWSNIIVFYDDIGTSVSILDNYRLHLIKMTSLWGSYE
jgi:hypothetical protein